MASPWSCQVTRTLNSSVTRWLDRRLVLWSPSSLHWTSVRPFFSGLTPVAGLRSVDTQGLGGQAVP